jgi:lipoprotein-releasing system ATP-binding protein
MLHIQGLHKSYSEVDTKLHILRGIDLTVMPGELVVIMGVSGSGKTTLLNCIGGLDSPDEGTILYNQTNISSLKGDALASFRNKNVGFIFQFHYLLPEFDILENVLMPGLIAGKRFDELQLRGRELLSAVGLEARLKHRPHELSGGECQRAAVARALMNQPDIILADEPSGNLDKGNSERLHQQLCQVCKTYKQTMLIATHNEHLAALADKVCILSEGTLMEKGR